MKSDALRLPDRVAQSEVWTCVRAGDHVCCALSGAADSVCLLRVLLTLQSRYGFVLTAVHINHNLRGTESDADAAFCQTLCETLAVPLQIFSVDVRETAAREHCSEELAARKCRYAAFAQAETDWIATAHTASDNLETLAHRLIRGASLHGLAAIPPKNGRILRPFLEITREEIEAYLKMLEQPYVTDSSNLSDRYTRNRIRHTVIPTLKHLNPSVEQTAAHTLKSLRREDDFLCRETEKAYAVCHTSPHELDCLESLHPALQIRCIAKLLEEENLSYDGKLLEKLLQICQTGGRWNLHGVVYAEAKPGRLYLKTRRTKTPTPKKIPLRWGKNHLYPGFAATAKLITMADMEKKNENFVKTAIVHEKFANCCVDYDKIKGSIFLCPRIPGARMRLAGRDFTSR